MSGVIIGKLKDAAWHTGVGSVLILWYLFDLAQRFRLIFGHQMFQFDWQLLYILIDIMTLIYFARAKIKPVTNSELYKCIWVFLIPWFITYTFIDVFVPPLYQPASWYSYFIGILIDSLTIVVIAWNEIIKNKIMIRNLFKW